jgi:hypothetical protein
MSRPRSPPGCDARRPELGGPRGATGGGRDRAQLVGSRRPFVAPRPLMFPIGLSDTTLRERSSRSRTSTTAERSLYAKPASSATPAFEAARTRTPCAAIAFRRVSPRTRFLAWARDMVRPAPWAVEPNVSAIARLAPTRSAEPLSIEPPMMTGWPTSRYAAGMSGAPGPNAGVAPFRYTTSSSHSPSILCRSSLAVLWQTS